MNILKKTVLVACGVGLVGCASSRRALESGVIVEKQNLPEERALYVSIDGDRTPDRKLVFENVDTAYFSVLEPGNVICYRNRGAHRYLEVGANRVRVRWAQAADIGVIKYKNKER